MVRYLALIAVLFGAPAAEARAREEISGPVAAEILRVIDGDTILVEARPWPQQRVEVYVRIRGIDAPELKSKCHSVQQAGGDARQALEALTKASATIELVNITGDKYFGRIVADVVLPDGRSAGSDLLLAGLVQPYDGGRKMVPVCGD
ncbi:MULTISPECIES: thermonuclease family protein [unclassified Rhizobium]|uniref:thermonuclease family protein n=1 Tax=unclassified Rhizobium TaxID=2613769 RepID=UPI001AE930F8|nr:MULTISPECIES: thermonuclease family protein [unclassified Rhizobium]MBP2462882.1 endonuclease YncB(thermonuclease family) [Rhizobium sp. PvP014]MBP2530276.1 endonuclease YncB(thermonuclease family) [Rhizobium sp. PvP099]